MGGVEAMTRLRALDPSVKAAVSSGYSDADTLADHLAHGFAAAISKPWTAEELRRLVASLAPAPTPTVGVLANSGGAKEITS